ncbi:MAG TPA: hypothetical protein VK509_23260, partial [Polyangiales bacterium]|nr:hypothetical protein [Polyangiales bacterium]
DHGDGDPTPVLLHEVEVDGEFPNRFTMRVYDLPPEGAATPPSHGEPPVSFAMIFAANRDADWSEGFGDGDDRPEWLAGAAVNYMVVYVDGQTRDDGPAASIFRQPLGQGYHLIEVHELTPEQRAERVVCQDENALRALVSYNEMYGTGYADPIDIPDDDYEAYSQLEEAENRTCGGKVSMKVVPSGLEHPVQLHIGPELEFIDWT